MWRVEPICEVLTRQCGIKISPSGYYAFKRRGPSARDIRDAGLKDRIVAIWEGNFCCWGAKKVWHQLSREGEAVARCTVERLTREAGICGRVRGKLKRTTIASKGEATAKDLVKRNFWAPAPTCSGWLTSPMSPPGMAGVTLRLSPMSLPATSSAGQYLRK